MPTLVCVAVGLCAGLCGGLFGLGGGVIIVPSLVFFLKFDQHKAQGTSLLVLALPVAGLGAYNYFRSGDASLAAALCLAVGMVAGSYLGSRVAHGLEPRTMRRAFCVFIGVIGVYLFAKAEIMRAAPHAQFHSLQPWMVAALALGGVVAGMTGGLFGVGGGAVIVPFLVLALGFPQHLAQGTSLATLTLPVAAVGAFNYHRKGNMDVRAGLSLAVGVVTGSFLGSHVALGLDPVTMQRAFAAFVVAMATYLFLRK